MRRPDDSEVKQVRGSALLLSGRVFGRLVNGLTQILLARSFSKSAYGAFAYGIAFLDFTDIFTTLGLTRVVTRYVPVYEERGEHGKALGTIVVVFGTIVSLGLTAILLVHGFRGSIQEYLIHDRRSVSVLAVLIALSPVEALDNMTDGVLAVIGRPGAIFFRKHLLGPLLRIGVVLLIVNRHGSVTALAYGYLFVGLVGFATYATLLTRIIRNQGLPIPLKWRQIEYPIREIMGFAGPLLCISAMEVVLESTDAMVVGRIGGATQVAALRAVQPPARVITTVFISFSLLFASLAARLYARNDRAALNDAYWRTAAWVSMLSFPLFTIMFSFSGPLTRTLYGQRYVNSAPILALLALGYFVNATMGHNLQVLQIFRRLRFLMVVAFLIVPVNIAALIVLTRTFGVVGAASAKAGSFIVLNLILQSALRSTGVKFFDRRYARIYGPMVLAIVGLLIFQQVVGPPLVVGVALTGVIWLVMLFVTRGSLQLGAIFPELRRVPVARYLVSEPYEDEH
jgi:O-antigen/teichoic acid export membrane protein